MLAGLDRRNTGLPPHLLEEAAERKLAREGPGKNHSGKAKGAKPDLSRDDPAVPSAKNGPVFNGQAKDGILDSQPGIMESQVGKANASLQQPQVFSLLLWVCSWSFRALSVQDLLSWLA